MRAVTFETLNAAESDELLTTGEAAVLLNSSRQHVVDLCDRGDLPYVTVGRHRRVRRGDVEALRTRTQRMTPDQRRSLWLSYAVAGEIVQDPHRARELGIANLAKMRKSARGQAKRWLDEWERLLSGPIDSLLQSLTSHSPKGRELRQNSPFAGVLSDIARERVLASWKSANQGSR